MKTDLQSLVEWNASRGTARPTSEWEARPTFVCGCRAAPPRAPWWRRIFGATLLPLFACGGWSDADTKSATDSVRAQLMIEQVCAGDAGALGLCSPAQVRALERVSYCSNASMLYRHGQSVPDAGIDCQPRQ